MGLDMIITFTSGEKKHLVISELLHSKIFDPSNTLGSYKEIRKIRDYYKTNVTFHSSSAHTFIAELTDICNKIPDLKNETDNIIKQLQFIDVKSIRICGD